MSDQSFKLKFDGPAIIDGEIDVADFAPSVLAIGEIFRTTNQLFNGSRSTATVKLKATKEGSFEAFLNIDFSMLEAFKDFLDFSHENNEQIKSANDLLDLLLKGGAILTGVTTPVSVGLFFLIKKLKGKKPKFIKEDKGQVILEIDGETLSVDPRVIKLYENIQIRRTIEKATAVLEKPGITKLSFSGDSKSEQNVEIEKSERQYFKVPAPSEDEEEVSENIVEMQLQALNVSFKDGNKWRFTAGDEAFLALIEDVKFLNQITNNEISFSKGDIYVCDVKVIQKRNAQGLAIERVITNVKEHYPGGKQLKLL